MRLLLVRHGESTWNAQGRYQGRLDPPLSDRGREQALALATRLQAQPADPQRRVGSIVSSPLRRALETARACAQALDLPVAVDERLTEISHGAWEGLLREEIEGRWPAMVAAWRQTPERVIFPGGESLADVQDRFIAFLAGLDDAQGSMLIATHDVVVRIAALKADGRPLSAFNDVRVDNAALNEFSVQDGKLVAVHLGDVEHLGSLRSDTLSQAL